MQGRYRICPHTTCVPGMMRTLLPQGSSTNERNRGRSALPLVPACSSLGSKASWAKSALCADRATCKAACTLRRRSAHLVRSVGSVQESFFCQCPAQVLSAAAGAEEKAPEARLWAGYTFGSMLKSSSHREYSPPPFPGGSTSVGRNSVDHVDLGNTSEAVRPIVKCHSSPACLGGETAQCGQGYVDTRCATGFAASPTRATAGGLFDIQYVPLPLKPSGLLTSLVRFAFGLRSQVRHVRHRLLLPLGAVQGMRQRIACAVSLQSCASCYNRRANCFPLL